MSFNWREFYNLAGNLWDGSGPEACVEARQRSAISRAYYSVFIVARNRLQEILGRPYKRRTVHQDVRQDLETGTGTSWIELAALLDLMSEHRSNADYDDELKNRPEMLVPLQLEAARQGFDLVSKL
jgi:uncharacterized protein (UPF0332 family)